MSWTCVCSLINLLIFLSLYVMFSIFLSMLCWAAASFLSIFEVSVQVSAPYVIAGRMHWLYTFLLRHIGRLPFMMVLYLPYDGWTYDRLLKLQKKALRAACKTHYLHPSLSLFISTKTLNIFDLFEKNIATFMFNFQNGNVPIVFNQLFRTFESVHNHNTRNKGNLYISKKRTNTAKQSISYTGSKVWNDLPREIRCSKNKFTFNYKLKEYFLTKYKDKCYKCLDTECKICFQLWSFWIDICILLISKLDFKSLSCNRYSCPQTKTQKYRDGVRRGIVLLLDSSSNSFYIHFH